MEQLSLPLDLAVCSACGTSCGRQTRMVAGKAGTVVVWHADEAGPFDPPGPGDSHPADTVHPHARSWPCPHCATGPYEHRDTCEQNEVHPHDCRCRWCAHGITWKRCPRPDCGRGAHTLAPSRPDTVVCRAHGHQHVPDPVIVPPTAALAAAKVRALAAESPPSLQAGVG